MRAVRKTKQIFRLLFLFIIFSTEWNDIYLKFLFVVETPSKFCTQSTRTEVAPFRPILICSFLKITHNLLVIVRKLLRINNKNNINNGIFVRKSERWKRILCCSCWFFLFVCSLLQPSILSIHQQNPAKGKETKFINFMFVHEFRRVWVCHSG